MKKVLLILAMAMMFFACGAKGSKGSTFSLNLAAEPKSIDPQLSTDIAGGTVNELLSEGLLKRTPDGKPDPGIAEKWEVSPDGLKWTFHLRDAKWSNGDPITANDFKVGWLRALDPKTGAENAYLLFMIKNAEEFNSGHLQNAVNIPHDQIIEGIKAVSSDKNAPINLYCRSGRRAEVALNELKKAGYTNVTNHGGYDDLVKKGLK